MASTNERVAPDAQGVGPTTGYIVELTMSDGRPGGDLRNRVVLHVTLGKRPKVTNAHELQIEALDLGIYYLTLEATRLRALV